MNLEYILKEAVEQDASDIYLKADSQVFLRVDGKLRPVNEIILKTEEVEDLVFSRLSERSLQDFKDRPEINYAFSEESGRFRMNAYKQKSTVAAVIRRVKSNIPSFNQLYLPPIIGNLSLELRGLILVTGATGSGKSTTMAAMIDYRNKNSFNHIITIEDPIEFIHKDGKSIISQREVGSDTLCYEDSLKNALRQAPDVIMIGEMRDVESVNAALHFAETGHLVISTLHSPNANQTIDRLLQFFPSNMHDQILNLVSSNLKAIISQRLLPKSGSPGRIPAVEILINSPRIKELIAHGELSKIKPAIEAAVNEGMQTFDQAILKLFSSRLITMETALSYADSPNDVNLKMRGFNTG